MRLSPLAPVLARGAGELQIGIRDPLVLDGLSASERRFVMSLEGGRRIGAAERRRHGRLLDRLAGAGLDASARPAPACVRFHSASALAVEAAVALSRAGRAVSFADAARARRDPHTAAVAGGSRGALAAQRVRRVVPEAEVRSAHAAADVDVLVTLGPPLTLARALLATDAPHLLVACDERGVTVGPLVVPGATACAQCLGLAATDADRAWPSLALQCEARTPRTDALVASIAGALAAASVDAFLRGSAPPTWRVEDGSIDRVPHAHSHPQCACSAA